MEWLGDEVQEQVEGRGAAGRISCLRVRAEMCSLKIFIDIVKSNPALIQNIVSTFFIMLDLYS